MLFGDLQHLREQIPDEVPPIFLFRLYSLTRNLWISVWVHLLGQLSDFCNAASINANAGCFRLSMLCRFHFAVGHLERSVRACGSLLSGCSPSLLYIFPFQFALITLLAMTVAWPARIVWTEGGVTVTTAAAFAPLGGPAFSVTRVSMVWLQGGGFVLQGGWEIGITGCALNL